MILALLSAAAIAAPAPCDGTVSDFLASTRAGERAFAEMDLVGLNKARDAALAVVPCLQEPVPLEVAADFHRLMALASFTQGDEARVRSEFHAARRLVPGYQVPEAVAPEGHPLLDLYAASASADEGSIDEPVPPIGGSVTVDGVRGAFRPTGISTIVQAYDAKGGWVESRFVPAGDATPAWGPLPLEVERARRRRVTLVTIAGAGALGSGALYAGAWASRARFNDTDAATAVPDNELAGVRARTNALTLTSAGVGVATLAVTGLLAFTW